jgi:hypothetical protein
MRYIISLIVSLIIFNGCKNNTVAPGNDQSLSAIQVQNGIIYTLSVPKLSFGINDTLKAQLSAFNQSMVPDTLVTGFSPYLYNWTLKNDTGKVIMSGPFPDVYLVERIFLNPNQEARLYQINQAIKDQLGEPINAGSYILQWNLNNHGTPYLSFKLNIELR